MSKKKEDLLQIIAYKLATHDTLINTVVSSVADLLCVVKDIIPPCSEEQCNSPSVGIVNGKEFCNRCCLSFLTKGEQVEWKPKRDSIIRVVESVKSLQEAGYCDPGDMH